MTDSTDKANLFVVAAIKKYRFPSSKGDLKVEDLFDLPLVGNRPGFCLNSVALTLSSELKELGTESFVRVTPIPGKEDLENRLEIVKYVISWRQEKTKAAARRAEKNAERQKILDIIGRKQDEALSEASIEDLRKRLEELSAD